MRKLDEVAGWYRWAETAWLQPDWTKVQREGVAQIVAGEIIRSSMRVASVMPNA